MKLILPEKNFCPQCGSPTEIKAVGGWNRHVCRKYGHITYTNPMPAAACVVFDGDRLLLTLRDVEPNKGEWCLPGGFVEWGEHAEDAARRELREETGIEAVELSLAGVYNSITNPQRHVLLVGYRVDVWKGAAAAGDDAADVAWFSTADRPPLAFTSHEELLADVARTRNRQ